MRDGRAASQAHDRNRPHAAPKEGKVASSVAQGGLALTIFCPRGWFGIFLLGNLDHLGNVGSKGRTIALRHAGMRGMSPEAATQAFAILEAGTRLDNDP